jgi:hypothetical protein
MPDKPGRHDYWLGRYAPGTGESVRGHSQNLRNVAFDLLEHVDYRNFSAFWKIVSGRQEPQLVYRALQLLIPLGQKNYTSMFLPLLKNQDPEVLLLIWKYPKNGDISTIPALSPL